MRARFVVLLLIIALSVVVGAAAQSGPALKVRHVHVWVTDVERTKAFYRDKLGFTVSNERAGESVEFNGGALWFGRFKGTGPLSTNAITIGIGTASVHAAYDALKGKGVTLSETPSEAHGEWHFVFKDPDGYAIEVEGGK
jgi:catechol 2,3-dioxygenase-like lactoylglutathione lyase family enzyme